LRKRIGIHGRNQSSSYLQSAATPDACRVDDVPFRRWAGVLGCLPSLQDDPNRPEDMRKVDADEEDIGGDYTADACRHLIEEEGGGVEADEDRDEDFVLDQKSFHSFSGCGWHVLY